MSKPSLQLCLSSLTEDILVCVVSYLEPPDILQLGETCKRLHKLTSTRIVWVHAASIYVISRGFPFPNVDLDDLATRDLIEQTKHGYCLAHRWLDGMSSLQSVTDIKGASGISVSDVRFVSGQERLLVTISKSIWSAVSIWDIGTGADSKKLCEWSPRGAIFTGFALNGDERSTATIAISLQLNEQHFVEILSIFRAEDCTYSLKKLFSINTKMKPVLLAGDFLALTDDVAQTFIWNWKTGMCAILEHSMDDPSIIQANECIQVLFAYESILVVRARCIYLFPFPTFALPNAHAETFPPYKPIAEHSFGWVDGECVTICPFLESSQFPGTSWPSLSILVRGESDDPWASDIHNLELYTLDPNPSFDLDSQSDLRNKRPPVNMTSSLLPNHSPYLFPPRLTHKVASLRGSLSCKQIALGRFGTALWLQPRDRFAGGLLADIPTHLIPSSSSRNETLVAAVFPGSLNPSSYEMLKAVCGGVVDVETRVRDNEKDLIVVGNSIFENDAGSSWTSFDYDEVGGRVALGSSFGKVTILQL